MEPPGGGAGAVRLVALGAVALRRGGAAAAGAAAGGAGLARRGEV